MSLVALSQIPLCLYIITMVCTNHANSLEQDNSLEKFVSFVQSQRNIPKLNIFCNWPHRLIKQLWASGKTVTYGRKDTLQDSYVIFCADDYGNPGELLDLLKDGERVAVGLSWLVFGSNLSLETFHKSGDVAINRKVYFVNQESGCIYERYHVKGQTDTHILGNVFESNQDLLLRKVDESFMSRRGDLNGIQFRACGFRIADPLMYYSEESLGRIKWERDRKGSLIGDVTHERPLGIFSEVMELMKTDLNFSTTNILRKDDNVGYPQFVNGTFVSINGMIGDLLTGDIDIIMAPVEHVVGRYGMMDFMHGLSTLTMALLVGVNAGSEDREWLTYLLPFQEQLWLLLVTNSVVAVVAIRLVQSIHIYGWKFNIFGTLIDSLGEFWMVFMSYFGKPATANIWLFVPSTKILLFIIFLSGNLVFMFYKAALTSELSVRRKVLPFTSPEGYYESDYKLIHIFKQIDRMLKGYSHYPEMYWVGKAYYEQDHSDSYFTSYVNALDELTRPFSRKCLFTFTEKFRHYPEYKCKISKTWENHSPAILTMAMPKNWEHSEFIQHAMLRRIDSGTVSRIAGKYYNGQSTPCPVEVRGTSLGLFKVMGSTIVFSFGICLALVILLCEILRDQFKRNLTPCVAMGSNQEIETTFDEAIRLTCTKWGPKTHSYMTSFEAELKDILIYFTKIDPINRKE